MRRRRGIEGPVVPWDEYCDKPPTRWERYNERERIRRENNFYLNRFQQDLENAGFSRRTLLRHLENADFFINTFLLYKFDHTMQEGPDMVDEFFEFFIRQCTWSTPTSISEYCASLKKFYQCMLRAGYLEKQDYESLTYAIRTRKRRWMETCALYNEGRLPHFDESMDEDMRIYQGPRPLGCKTRSSHKFSRFKTHAKTGFAR